MQTTDDTNLDTKLSAIDKALAAARARKAAKEAAGIVPESAPSTPKVKKETQPDFAKSQKKEALNQAREAAKVQREADRQRRREAKAESSVDKKATHMKKVENAASKLPVLNETAQVLFTDITSNLPAAQVAAIALHLQHFNRVNATARAVNQRVQPGDRVRIVGGDPRYIGKSGTVDRAQRIRCYVNVPGSQRPVYLFTSDVELVQVEAEAAEAQAV